MQNTPTAINDNAREILEQPQDEAAAAEPAPARPRTIAEEIDALTDPSFMTSLARGRIHIAALAVGTAQRALDESIAFAASATQGGTPIGGFQLVQAMLADQQTGVSAGRALVRDSAKKWLSDEDRRIAPSVAKVFCTEMAGNVADLAVQIHGGTGYMRGVPVERIYRDVRLLRLYEGTSEIQRLIIGGGLMKAARKPT